VRALDPELVWLAHQHEPWRPRTSEASRRRALSRRVACNEGSCRRSREAARRQVSGAVRLARSDSDRVFGTGAGCRGGSD
jgi:hypothetical protein